MSLSFAPLLSFPLHRARDDALRPRAVIAPSVSLYLYHWITFPKAFKLRDTIIYAVAWSNISLLEDLVRSLMKFSPCAVSLARGGLRRLLSDASLRAAMDSQSLALLQVLKAKWMAEVDRSMCGQPFSKPTLCALGKNLRRSHT